ncbi:MAG: hypothetical protein ACYTAN_14560 [Planctomycetota bacterium]|jgi:hypothetical protein
MSNGLMPGPGYPMTEKTQDQRTLLERVKMHEKDLEGRLLRVREARRAMEDTPGLANALNAISAVDWR